MPRLGPAALRVSPATALCLLLGVGIVQPAEAACGEHAAPFDRGCRTIEVAAMYHVEAWDENESRDTMAGGTVAMSWAFLEGWALVGEAVGYRVATRASPARLGGGIGLVRRRLYERDRLSLFTDAGLGAS